MRTTVRRKPLLVVWHVSSLFHSIEACAFYSKIIIIKWLYSCDRTDAIVVISIYWMAHAILCDYLRLRQFGADSGCVERRLSFFRILFLCVCVCVLLILKPQTGGIETSSDASQIVFYDNNVRALCVWTFRIIVRRTTTKKGKSLDISPLRWSRVHTRPCPHLMHGTDYTYQPSIGTMFCVIYRP